MTNEQKYVIALYDAIYALDSILGVVPSGVDPVWQVITKPIPKKYGDLDNFRTFVKDLAASDGCGYRMRTVFKIP